jgi:hypothetical protein
MVKLNADQQSLFVRTEPAVFQPIKGAWGKRGCTQVNLAAAAEPSVRQALVTAWKNSAPKRLAQQLSGVNNGSPSER